MGLPFVYMGCKSTDVKFAADTAYACMVRSVTGARSVEVSASARTIGYALRVLIAVGGAYAHMESVGVIAGPAGQNIFAYTIGRRDRALNAGYGEPAHMARKNTHAVNAKAQAFAVVGYREQLARSVVGEESVSIRRKKTLAQNVRTLFAK